ncbi:MAG: SH3 domain-containing protein [Pseudomonadaceae bacterium]|nr:SH3 domain-containing protein [Pseudomonadaceae bacterium]
MKTLSIVLALLLAIPVWAEDAAPEGKGFPRYATLKKGEVNVRSGPGNEYPILWIYQRTGYPVQLLARYDNYYKVRDAEAEEGWVYVGMVSAQKGGLVGGKQPAPLYRRADTGSAMSARLSPGVVVGLDDCDGVFCKVEAEGYKGYVEKARLLMVE